MNGLLLKQRYIRLFVQKNRFNVDFATQRIYSAIDDVDQVNHFGEYLYDVTDSY